MERTREQLFAVLVREHQAGLAAFVRTCLHEAMDADDLVQETFLTAWRQLDEYDPQYPFAGWLRGIARNKVLAYYRDRATSRRHGCTLPPEAVAAIADEFERFNRPPRGEVYADCFAALRECLATLARADRELIERAYRQDERCRTIAAHLGSTLEAIKKRLQRVRAELRDCILGKLGLEVADG